MGTGDCINIFMAAQPCNTANEELGIASISSWLLSPVLLQKGTGNCINIFMATQPCNTANGYWRLHQYLCGYSALSHCKWVLGIASISSWLLIPVKMQMRTGDCINIFMAVQPCNTANGYSGLHQYLYGYSALSHCKWVLEIASISSWLLSPGYHFGCKSLLKRGPHLEAWEAHTHPKPTRVPPGGKLAPKVMSSSLILPNSQNAFYKVCTYTANSYKKRWPNHQYNIRPFKRVLKNKIYLYYNKQILLPSLITIY